MQHQDYKVAEDDRHLYGMSPLEVYSSSHPSDPSCILPTPRASTFPPVKRIFAIGDSDLEKDFRAIYERSHDDIVTSIEHSLQNYDWGLNVFRLGFHSEPLENPITIHLVVGKAKVEDSRDLIEAKASKIVSDILDRLAITDSYPHDHLKSVHVDVCRASLPDSSKMPKTLSLLDSNPNVYSSSTRNPGSSIGPAASENIGSQGTFSGFIEHRDKNGQKTIYALTCRHVVDPHKTLSPLGSFFKLETGNKRLHVTSPQSVDHDNTIKKIKAQISSLERSIKAGRAIQLSSIQLKIFSELLKEAEQYNIELGYVYATSGCQRKLPGSESRADWSISFITNNTIVAENKHGVSTGLFESFDLEPLGPLDDAFVTASREYLADGPPFKAVRHADLKPFEIVFKSRSRTKGWTAGRFNAIRSTQKDAGWISREWCLLSLDGDPMSACGDSGSIIVDKDFQPIAMMWGGDKHGLANGPVDLTYASPLSDVSRDIEICMGWEQGSVTLV